MPIRHYDWMSQYNMIEFFPAYLHSNISFFVLLIVSVAATVFSYLLYRRTVPPVSRALRLFLSILRGMAVAGILSLFFAPEITLIWFKNMPKQIILAVDQSASMSIEENGKNRMERARTIARKLESALSTKAKIKIYTFNTDTIKPYLSDSDTAFGGTDYSLTLRNILKKEKKIDELIMLSDGNITSGEDPSFSSLVDAVRINTIGLGDTVDAVDLIIMDVKTNEMVYEGKATQIRVELMGRGIARASSLLSIKLAGEVVHAEKVEFESPGSIIAHTFELVPRQVGLNRLAVELTALEDEGIISNNRFIKTIDVKKGKIDVGLISSQIDFEAKFLKLILEENEEINLKTAVLSANAREFFNKVREVIDNCEVLIFYNIPASDEVLKTLLNVNEAKIPAMFILNQRISDREGQLLNKFIPIPALKTANEPLQIRAVRTIQGKLNPQLNIFESENQNSLFWEKCPPIISMYNDVQFSQGVQVLLESGMVHPDSKKRVPVMLSYRGRGQKCLLLLGTGFWRWHFSFAENKEFTGGWSDVLKNMVRWLASGVRDKNVIVSSGKKTHETGQLVILNTQVYDGSFNPVNDALVRTEVLGPTGSFELESLLNAQGTYSSNYSAFAEGEYQIRSSAYKNDVLLGMDSTEIVVVPVNREFIYTNQNYRFLIQMSQKSGGKYYSEDNASDILNNIDLNKRRQRIEKSLELWHQIYTLILITLLLSLEWLIRKRTGLA
jgi:hypothetical protein